MRINRRHLLTLAGAALTAPAAPAGAQQEPRGRRIPVVGFVGFASAAVDGARLAAFRKGLAALGHVEGRTIVIESRSSEGNVERGHALIAELAALPVDVFLSPGPAASRALVRKTRIPVVAIALPATPSEPELFSSFARPGGTVTGFSAFGEEMSAKRIEMLREVRPGLKVLGVLHNATDPTFSAWGQQTVADARRLGLEAISFGLTSPSAAQVGDHFKTMRDRGPAAVIAIRDFMTSEMMQAICRLGEEFRLPVVGEHSDFARAGALFSYGADLDDLFARAAGYVDRIVRGERAAELPIQLPTKFELVVNLATARRLDIAIPQSVLLLADEAID